MSEGDPFAALGLPARADVSDDDVRAAWRRIAAATHPDRDDGGSPERFAAAAAAYATLRTPFGRGEALADLAETTADSSPAQRTRWHIGPLRGGPACRRPPRHLGRGAWLRLTVRILAVVTVGAFAFAAAGWTPGTLALWAGTATGLFMIAGHRGRYTTPTTRDHGYPGGAPVATGRVGSSIHSDQEPA